MLGLPRERLDSGPFAATLLQAGRSLLPAERAEAAQGIIRECLRNRVVVEAAAAIQNESEEYIEQWVDGVDMDEATPSASFSARGEICGWRLPASPNFIGAGPWPDPHHSLDEGLQFPPRTFVPLSPSLIFKTNIY